MTQKSTKTRITSYDTFRGILLIAMIIFHVAANLSTIPFNHELFYWIPAGYTLFLGVILGQFLKNRSKKSLKIALKLLALFLIPNLIILIKSPQNLPQLIPGNSEIFSFEILLPMSLVTFSCIALKKIPSKIIPIFILITIFAALILDFFHLHFYNLSFIIFGLTGYFAARQWNLDNQFKKFPEIFTIFFTILTIIIFWFTSKFGISHILTITQCFSIYFAIKSSVKTPYLAQIGADSLFLYIAHIIIIKLFSKWIVLENFIQIMGFSILVIGISLILNKIFKKSLNLTKKLHTAPNYHQTLN